MHVVNPESHATLGLRCRRALPIVFIDPKEYIWSQNGQTGDFELENPVQTATKH